MSDESIKPPTTSNNNLAPSLNYIGTKTRVKFGGSCLKQNKIIFYSWTNSEYINCLRNKSVGW